MGSVDAPICPPPPHGSTLRKEARDLQGDLGFAEGTMKRIELWNKLDGKLYAWGGALLRWGGGSRRSANRGGGGSSFSQLSGGASIFGLSALPLLACND